MTTINIDGKPFSYEEEDLSFATITPISAPEALEVLKLSKKLLGEKGLNFYLYWGTLLGAVREKGVIKGDEDVDVYIDDEEKFRRNIPYFHANGMKLIRSLRGMVYSFRATNNCYIDFYVVRPLKWSIWRWSCMRIVEYNQPKWIFQEHQEIDFMGEKFLCPKDPEKVLSVLYGPTWRTPIKGHKFPSEVKSAYYYHCFVKIVKKIIRYDDWYMYIKKVEK